MGSVNVVPVVSLTDAISNFEAAQSALGNADTAQAAATAKADAAIAAKAAADQADVDAVKSFNDSADVLIAAITASKR
jgi:hypothetical protein